MDLIYREQILEHYKHPFNFGVLDNPSSEASDNIVSCGDSLSMQVLVKNKSSLVADIKFQGSGCAISIASASMLTESVKGQKIGDLKNLSKNDILTMLGIELSPTRVKCALLSLEVLHKTLNQLT